MPIVALEKRIIEPKEGVQFSVEGKTITVTGPKGSLTRTFKNPQIELGHENGKAVVSCSEPRRKDMALVGTVEGHINNMVKGVTEGYEYQLKLVYAHFPVKLSAKDNLFVIENFVGEKSPRKAKIIGDSKVQIKGDMVIVTGIDKEAVGQTAANIEQATKITGFDNRVFQDGIYIVSKGV